MTRFPRISSRRLGVIATAMALLSGVVVQRAAAQDTTRVVLRSDTIRLQDAIAIALSQNIVARFARNNVLLDSLSVRSARNAFLPNLSASSSASQGFGARSGQGQNSLSISGGLSSGVTLFNGRQNVNTLRQARLNALASGEEFGRSRQTVVFTVASDYLNLITLSLIHI